MADKFYVSYNTVHKLIKGLAEKITNDGFDPDVIVARPHETKSDYFEILYMLDLKMDVGYHRDITVGKKPTLTYHMQDKQLL